MINTVQSLGPAEGIAHYGAVRLRVNGVGNLIFTFQSFDDTQTQQLAPIIMNTVPGREPRVLSNFIAQRAFLRGETTQLNEIFKINRIIIFVKQLWADYPNGS